MILEKINRHCLALFVSQTSWTDGDGGGIKTCGMKLLQTLDFFIFFFLLDPGHG